MASFSATELARLTTTLSSTASQTLFFEPFTRTESQVQAYVTAPRILKNHRLLKDIFKKLWTREAFSSANWWSEVLKDYRKWTLWRTKQATKVMVYLFVRAYDAYSGDDTTLRSYIQSSTLENEKSIQEATHPFFQEVEQALLEEIFDSNQHELDQYLESSVNAISVVQYKDHPQLQLNDDGPLPNFLIPKLLFQRTVHYQGYFKTVLRFYNEQSSPNLMIEIDVLDEDDNCLLKRSFAENLVVILDEVFKNQTALL